jgi:hypothetical protein
MYSEDLSKEVPEALRAKSAHFLHKIFAPSLQELGFFAPVTRHRQPHTYEDQAPSLWRRRRTRSKRFPSTEAERIQTKQGGHYLPPNEDDAPNLDDTDTNIDKVIT